MSKYSIRNKLASPDWILTFSHVDISDSPFRVGVKNPVDAKKVKCYGPGIEPMGVKTGAPATFTVDTTEAGEAPLEVTCTDQRGRVQPAQLTPVAEGPFCVHVYFKIRSNISMCFPFNKCSCMNPKVIEAPPESKCLIEVFVCQEFGSNCDLIPIR